MQEQSKMPIQITGGNILSRNGSAYDETNLYLVLYQKIPNRIYLDKVNIREYRRWFEREYKSQVIDRFFVAWRMDKASRLAQEDDIYYCLEDQVIVYLDTNLNSLKILFQNENDPRIKILHEAGAKFKTKEERKHYINLISRSNHGFSLNEMEIMKTMGNLTDHYNKDFHPIHKQILKRLNTQQDKGIVLLHGKPGTGKTSYIRFLISHVDKDVIFLPPAMAGALTEPGLISILTDNPNSIFVIEDAENILVGRDSNRNSPVSTLLNISDGLLADCLNIQIICSFNTDLANIDRALLRKGRLIARYDFKDLELEKSKNLAKKIGYPFPIERPMTLSELYNFEDLDFERNEQKSIGFSFP